MDLSLETGDTLIPTLEAGKYFRVMSISSRQKLVLFSADPPYLSVLLFVWSLRKV